MNTTAVTAMVANEQEADEIVGELEATGFSKDNISAIFPDWRSGRDFIRKAHLIEPPASTPGSETAGLLGGALGGGLLGGLMGWLVGIIAWEMTAAGTLITAGPIASVFGASALCAAIGGLSGALACVGVSEARILRNERMIRAGRILMMVHTQVDAEIERAIEVFHRHHAEAISYTGNSFVVTR